MGQEPPKKRARVTGKRGRTEIAPNPEQNLLNDKEKLLTMSSKKLEEYVQSLARPLTIDEEKKLKRQRRLIKNRESAQLSRQKKKQYVEDLERKVQALTAETESLRTQVNQLTNNNLQLEEQVTCLQNFINEQGHEVPVPGQSVQLFNKNTAATAGICMFVILFSFGLFFSAGTAPGAVDFASPKVYTGRTLAEYPAIEGPKETYPQISAKRFNRDFDEEIEFPQTKRAKVELVTELDDADWEEEIDSGFTVAVPNNKPSHQIVVRPETETKPANSSFIYCSEAHQLTGPIIESPPQNDGPIINILLPAAVLNGTIPFMNDLISEPENSLFEVSCQVLNITVFPYFPTVDHLAVPQHLLS